MVSEFGTTAPERPSDLAPAATRQLRVLVVEDELLIAWELSDMLARLGHEVCGLAVDTGEALALATEHRPDLVLMDVMLRRGDDGITAAAAIQAAMPARVVFSTACANDPATRARMRAVGARGVLSKPVAVKELRRTLAEALRDPPA